jgi:hypothetical protein
MSAVQAARDAFKNVHNDTTIILPGKKGEIFDTDFVDQQSNAEVFIQAINLCDRGMMRALLIPALIFTNGDGTGSYSLGQEHAKTFDKILDSMNEGFKATTVDQLIREIVAYNFPREAWEKEGRGEFGKVELSPDEIQKEIDILEKAVNMGVVDVTDLNDLNSIRSKIRMEPRKTPIVQPGGLPPGAEDPNDDGDPFGNKDDEDDGEGEKKPPRSNERGGKGDTEGGGNPPPG